MPPSEEVLYQTAVQIPAIPLHLSIAIYAGVALLIVILLMLFRISGQLRGLNSKTSRSSRSTKTQEPEVEESKPNVAEVRPDTKFEEFLNEDPERRDLAKKEQFKEYRKWRAEKGLNWKK